MENNPGEVNKMSGVTIAKKPITFWKMLLSFIFNSITVFLCLGLPFMIGVMVIIMTKFHGAFVNAQDASILQGVLNSPLGSTFSILFTVVSSILIILVIFQDMVKNYQVSNENYKKVVGFLAIILAIRMLPGFNTLGLITTLVSIGLFYWLMTTKFQANKIILEKKVLTLKNGLIIAAVSLISGLTVILLY